MDMANVSVGNIALYNDVPFDNIGNQPSLMDKKYIKRMATTKLGSELPISDAILMM